MNKSLLDLKGFKLGDRVIMRVKGYYAGALGEIKHLEWRGRGKNREACCLVIPDSAAEALTQKGDGFYTVLGHVEHTDIPYGAPSPDSVASFGIIY